MKKTLWVIALMLTGACSSTSDITDQAVAELRSERAQWVARAVNSYSFDLNVACLCPSAGAALVTVVNGSVTTVINKSDGQPAARRPDDLYRTITALYDYLIDAAGRADDVNVDFDRNTHIPSQARIDFSRLSLNDEVSLYLSNFTPK